MTPDITIDSVVFKKIADTETGSIRRDTTLGLQSPRVFTVKHQETKNSKTGEQVVRSLMRLDFTTPVGTPATPSVDSCQIVLEVPASSSAARMQEVIDGAIAALSSATLVTSILNREI